MTETLLRFTSLDGLTWHAERTEYGWSPASLGDDLVARYRADAIAQADNTTVAVWPDIGPNGYDLGDDGTTTQDPTLQWGEINGRNALVFDGTTDSLRTVTFEPAIAQPYTLCWVAKPTAITGANQRLISGPAAITLLATNGRWRMANNGVNLDTTLANGQAGVAQYGISVFNGATSRNIVDGTSLAGATGTDALDRLTVGSDVAQTGGYFGGAALTIFVFKGDPDATLLGYLEAFLAELRG